MHLLKGAIINFSTRTIGMFEVVEPQLEGDEVFDSSLLKQMVESLIASGKRNICVDLAGQDYLYSDAINALIGINKRMLDVMGRLSLVAPQPPVMEILKKGGIANILKIFENDDELMRVSQQLMGGAPPVMSAPAAPPMPQEPQSEFDELRSEIGSAFGNLAPPPQRAAPQRREAAPPQSPFADASFPTSRAQPQPRQPFPPPPPPTGPAPRYAPPPPPLRSFDPAAQKPVPRPVVPPPPPIRPPAPPMTSGAETRRMPSVPEVPVPPAAGRPQPQFEAVAEPAPQPEADLEQFEATLEKKAPQVIPPKRKDRFDEELETIKKKRSFAPVLVTLIVLIILGAGGYYAYTTGLLNKPPFAPAVTPAPETALPQVPVTVPEPAVTKPVDTVPVAAPVAVPVEVKTPEPKPVAPAASPAVDAKAAAAKAAAARAAAEKAALAREAAAKAAAVKAAAAKEAAARAAAEKATAREAAAQAAAARAAAAKEAAARAAAEKAAAAKEAAAKGAAAREAAIKEAAARGAAAREAAAARAAEPPPPPKPSVVEVIEEPDAPPPPKPVVSAPPPPPPAPEPEPAAAEPAAGETGTIFMSSNPPLADVYLDGKLIGKTSIKELTVPAGTHTVRLVKGDKEMTKQMTFLPGKNPSVFIPIK